MGIHNADPISWRKRGMFTILCFGSQGNKAFLRYFYQVWSRKTQCGAWLQINFSYFVIFTYMEKFLPQWWQLNIVSLNFDFHKEFSSNLMRNRIHFVFRSKTQEGNKKKNQYLVTEVLGSLLNETGRNLIKFYEPTLCLQIKKMSKGIKTVRHSLLKLLCNAPTYLLSFPWKF